jgi:hypothetical protein
LRSRFQSLQQQRAPRGVRLEQARGAPPVEQAQRLHLREQLTDGDAQLQDEPLAAGAFGGRGVVVRETREGRADLQRPARGTVSDERGQAVEPEPPHVAVERDRRTREIFGDEDHSLVEGFGS